MLAWTHESCLFVPLQDKTCGGFLLYSRLVKTWRVHPIVPPSGLSGCRLGKHGLLMRPGSKNRMTKLQDTSGIHLGSVPSKVMVCCWRAGGVSLRQ